MAAIANGSVYGYDFAVAPEAEVNDGLFDVILVKKVPVYQYILLVPKMLNKTFHKSSLIEYFKVDWIEIKSKEKEYLHVDGEGLEADSMLRFEINPASIKLLKKLVD
jgi:diacylglycerol kinase family enzyme